MGPPNSRQVPRDWRYLGKHQRGSDLSPTGLSPSTEDLSRSLRLDRPFVTSFLPCKTGWCSHDPDTTTLAGLHSAGLGYFRFARRYSGSRGFFPFLGLLRCFSSPRCLHTPYVFRCGFYAFNVEGFPIQKSPDQSLLSSSPRLIAATPRLSSALGARTSTMHP